MHSLIDADTVERIRISGVTSESISDRVSILEQYSLRHDIPADNVIISGCMVIGMLPHVVASLASILDRFRVSYTFLSKEYCCGNYLYRPPIQVRNEDALSECRELSKEFIGNNIRQAQHLGARRLVIFCSPCYPIYKHAFPEEQIIFYPALIAEVMGRISLKQRIDYYAGCYRLHRKLSPVPMDLKSTEDVFRQMDGLEVHRISAPNCCYTPEGLSHINQNAQTGLVVHVCTGCYGQHLMSISEESGMEAMMLPQFVEKALKQVNH
jgi:hypothetical protein